MFFDDFILYIGMSKVEQSVVLKTFFNSYIIKYNIRHSDWTIMLSDSWGTVTELQYCQIHKGQ
jgi:hypothetical protein